MGFPKRSPHPLTDLSDALCSQRTSPCLMDNVIDSQRTKSTENPGAIGVANPKESPLAHIGIDLLGGDLASLAHLLATLHALYSEISTPFCLTVFAHPDMTSSIEAFKVANEIKRLEVVETREVIDMDEDPLHAIRKKRGASMCLGMELLKNKQLDALISTGNTGALIASAKLHLPMLKGISRAALITLLPTRKEPVAVIDVGANIQCTPEHLVHFAQMGLAYQKSRGIAEPKIGLLNIGTEEKKGRLELRETYKLLQSFSGFAGNVEGKEVFSGKIHVLVTDGFTGNVFLKTAEGISAFILETLHNNKKLLPFSGPLLRRLEQELYSAEYPGAILCGVDGIILKCHGDAEPEALKCSVEGALKLIEENFLNKIKTELISD
ncbi:phosphate acyltransferase PlsX [Candidatus Neptunochlamydia vexilliferae]|uniref:phosphate acyltransferase PlsX n=1 Tax=Candidatus Neptunichlamydia vexilliferae TaxID=1651774 RepID=UPI001890FA9A|nr:phosphate acyltransferase PlsX [Candidatus Neptunochlamydia vexilliferae]